jgi:hypothetical protein
VQRSYAFATSRQGLLIAPLLFFTFLLWDALSTWDALGLDRAILALFAVSLLGICGIGIAFFLIRRGRHVALLQNFALIVCSVILSVALLEILLRATPRGDVLLWTSPGEFYRLETDPQVVPGASPVARFTINDVGLRGPAWPKDPTTYKIVTVGGSTTQNAELDDEADWTFLMMGLISSSYYPRSIWAASAGLAGHTTVHHHILLRTLTVFQRIDAVLLLIGVNDLAAALAYGGASTQDVLEQDAEGFRLSITRFGFEESRPLYRRLRTYQLVRTAMRRIASKLGLQANATRMDEPGLIVARKQYARLPVVPSPKMTIALTEYESRIRMLEDDCRALHLRCIFMTQPSLWREDLDSKARALLCCSVLGHRASPTGWDAYGKPSLKDSEAMMSAYNNVLLETCSRRKLECIDLAAAIPKTLEIFYDDFHFTEVGSRRVASTIADYLSRAPLSGGE